MKSDFGIVGMGVMGQNLALNVESKGFTVSVYNRTPERTEEFVSSRAKGKRILATYSIEEFVRSLERPRRTLIMVQAGPPVDAMIEQLLPQLERGDILIDGGNSHFTDTERRLKSAEEHGVLYLGTGISGGEYGALHGPSLMPGGHREAYEAVEEIFLRIAALVEDGPCCTYIGPGGSGHYVKMVHNGIEYGFMEILAESYDLMRRALKMGAKEMSQIYAEWNEDELNSYLVKITSEVLARVDEETKRPLVEVILDKAEQKGTGKWASQNALDLGVPIPTITAAVNARIMSAFKEERVMASKVLSGPSSGYEGSRGGFLSKLKDACYLSMITAYGQGMRLLQEASTEYDWGIKLDEIARIWKGGCIIRAKLLDLIQEAYAADPKPANLLVAGRFKTIFEERIEALREVIVTALKLGIPVPGMAASLNYYDSYRTARLPANLIQAQRDYFGAHTYERVDKEGRFHTRWQET